MARAVLRAAAPLLLAAAALCVPLADWDTEEPIVPLTPHHHTAREEATAAAMSEFAEQLEHPSELSYANQMKLVDMLNERFMNGHPSNNFSEAGVVMHQFDDSGFDTTTRRLREGGVSKWSPWLPCPEGQWCSKFGDRFSVSVLNARVPFSFNEYNGGIIINPDTAQRGTMCAWASDARSFRAARSCLPSGVHFRWGDGKQMFERREGCIPGCMNGVEGQLEDWDTVLHDQASPTWCNSTGPDSWCPWRPTQLKRMMEQQERGFRNTDCAQNNGCRYNEVRAHARPRRSCPSLSFPLPLPLPLIHTN